MNLPSEITRLWQSLIESGVYGMGDIGIIKGFREKSLWQDLSDIEQLESRMNLEVIKTLLDTETSQVSPGDILHELIHREIRRGTLDGELLGDDPDVEMVSLLIDALQQESSEAQEGIFDPGIIRGTESPGIESQVVSTKAATPQRTGHGEAEEGSSPLGHGSKGS